jgi:hypothetical protein
MPLPLPPKNNIMAMDEAFNFHMFWRDTLFIQFIKTETFGLYDDDRKNLWNVAGCIGRSLAAKLF